ncbi:MAG: alanine racemase C-terminal domain-containing protein [Rhodoglobus sp.]
MSGVRRTATIDLVALKSTLLELLERDDSFVLDARADAYGHGADAIIATATEAGVSQILVSPRSEFSSPTLVTETSGRPLVSAEAYGLDGTHPPIMTVVGEVIGVKRASEGAGVSYGYTYRTSAESHLALVGLGYADGIPRLASNRASVFVAGGQHPLAGRIAMDQFVADCGSTEPQVGDDVVLFGDPALGFPSAIQWAVHTERPPLELTAGIAPRVQRVFS